MTLILIAILFMAVGAVLYSLMSTTRQTNYTFEREQCYFTAISGVNMAKTWLVSPPTAIAQLGNTRGTILQNVVAGAINMSNAVRDVVNHRDNKALAVTMSDLVTSQPYMAYFSSVSSSVGNGTVLPDGRTVICQVSSEDSPLLGFFDDRLTSTPSGSLFSSTAGAHSYVRRMRLTSPYANDDLRYVSLIIESEGVVRSVGQHKKRDGTWKPEQERVIQQKVLIYPGWHIEGSNAGPPLAPGAAIISGAAVTVDGTSSIDVHWAPVWSKGAIDLLDLTFTNQTDNQGHLDRDLDAQHKFWGAGASTDIAGNEKWLRWQTADILYEKQGSNRTQIFPPITAVINGVSQTFQVYDFFSQIMNGAFGADWAADSVDLTGGYNTHSTTIANGLGILYDGQVSGSYPVGTGALVQNWAPIGAAVDTMINVSMDYGTWRNYAIVMNGYLRPNSSGSGYVNSNGQTLYVKADGTLTILPTGNTVLTDLNQLSMKPLVPTNGNTYGLPDRILFVDTVEGTENGTPVSFAINSSDNWFWKGLMYVNGSISTSGGGAFPSVLMKNPDEYDADSTGASTGHLVTDCYLDGVLFVSGTMSRTGNARVYGSIITKNGYGGSGSPEVFYNSRLKDGKLFAPGGDVITGTDQLQWLVSGPIAEMPTWP